MDKGVTSYAGIVRFLRYSACEIFGRPELSGFLGLSRFDIKLNKLRSTALLPFASPYRFNRATINEYIIMVEPKNTMLLLIADKKIGFFFC